MGGKGSREGGRGAGGGGIGLEEVDDIVHPRAGERRMKLRVAAVTVLVALVAAGLAHAQQDGLTPEVTALHPRAEAGDGERSVNLNLRLK